MALSVDAVFLKQEYCDLPLHITLDLNPEGYLNDIKPAIPITTDPVVASSRVNSACPACQCFISINIIVHGNLEDKINLKPVKEEPCISSDEYENIEPLTIIDDYGDGKNNVKTDELETVIVDRLSTKRKSDSKEKYSSKKTKTIFEENDSTELATCSHCKAEMQAYKLKQHERSCAAEKKKPPKSNKTKKKSEKNTDRVIFCVYCFKVFETRVEQKEHIKNHDQCCYICDPPVFFGSLDPVRLHYRHKHFDLHPLRHECQECPKCKGVFRSTQFNIHVEKCVPWHCEICNKTFNKRETFKVS